MADTLKSSAMRRIPTGYHIIVTGLKVHPNRSNWRGTRMVAQSHKGSRAWRAVHKERILQVRSFTDAPNVRSNGLKVSLVLLFHLHLHPQEKRNCLASQGSTTPPSSISPLISNDDRLQVCSVHIWGMPVVKILMDMGLKLSAYLYIGHQVPDPSLLTLILYLTMSPIPNLISVIRNTHVATLV